MQPQARILPVNVHCRKHQVIKNSNTTMGLFLYSFCWLGSTDIATGVSSEQQRKVMCLAEVWHTATFFCSKVNLVDVSMFHSQKTHSKRKHHKKINMRSALFWVIMHRIVWFLNDIFGLPISPKISVRIYHYTQCNPLVLRLTFFK